MRFHHWIASILVLLVCSGSTLAQNQFAKTFLLETNADYEIRFRLPAELAGEATLVSVYIEDDQGPSLSYTQIFRGLGAKGASEEISLPLRTPEGANQATLLFSSDVADTYSVDDVTVHRLLSLPADRQAWLERMSHPDQVFTGLVIDARGLPISRGMSPRIWSESGRLIYGGVAAPMDFLQAEGVVVYGQELTPELLWRIRMDPQFPFVAPLHVRAKDVVGITRTSVLISNSDAERILGAVANYDFLAQYAVIFLVD